MLFPAARSEPSDSAGIYSIQAIIRDNNNSDSIVLNGQFFITFKIQLLSYIIGIAVKLWEKNKFTTKLT